MIDFCILGSGISGSTIANILSKKYTVKVFDKARGPGGRSSNKRFKDNLSFDHGVQYISPKSKEFLKLINSLDKNINTFVISHKGEVLYDKFRSVIKFEKKNYFSQIVHHERPTTS